MQSDHCFLARAVPWKSILTSVPCWALLVTTLGNNWAFYMLIVQIPIYMKTILHFDLKSVRKKNMKAIKDSFDEIVWLAELFLDGFALPGDVDIQPFCWPIGRFDGKKTMGFDRSDTQVSQHDRYV